MGILWSVDVAEVQHQKSQSTRNMANQEYAETCSEMSGWHRIPVPAMCLPTSFDLL